MTRRYTRSEVRSILAKAVEEGGSVSPEAVDGLSLEEIKQIGAQVGIDAGRLERAARSIAPAATIDRRSALAGGPTAVSIERRVDGDLDSVNTHEIVSAIRAGMGSPGTLSEVNGLLEWRSGGDLGQRVITLSARDGVTTVSGTADLTQAAVITHLPASLIGVLGSAIGFITAANSGNEIGMMFCVALLPAVLLGTRKLFARLSRSESGKLERVVEEVSTLVESSGGAEPGRGGA